MMPMIRCVALAIAALVAMAVHSVAFDGSRKGEAILLEAVRNGNLSKVEEVISVGENLEVRDDRGRTPLLLATHANAVEIAKMLIAAGADVNAKDSIKDTPFLYAGAEGRIEILKTILATGKANLKDTNRYGGTALIPAAHHGHPGAVQVLLESGVDIDHVNSLGWTALMEAVILGDGGPVYQEIVGLLIDAGAASISDNDGRTPLDHARSNHFVEMAERIEAGPKK